MARRRRFSQTVEVEVDVSEILSELDDDQILEEARSRKLGDKFGDRDLVEDLLRCLKRGDTTEAIVFLERALHPKFTSLKLCEQAFAALKSAVS